MLNRISSGYFLGRSYPAEGFNPFLPAMANSGFAKACDSWLSSQNIINLGASLRLEILRGQLASKWRERLLDMWRSEGIIPKDGFRFSVPWARPNSRGHVDSRVRIIDKDVKADFRIAYFSD
jgi:hypothetical protein